MKLDQRKDWDLAGLQALLDTLPVAFYVKDANSRILRVNDACAQAIGDKAAGLRGTRGESLMDAQALQHMLAREQAAFASGKTLKREERFWHAKLQQHRWGQTYEKPVYDSAGRPVYLMGTTIDITSHKQLQLLMAAEHLMLERLVARSPLPRVLEALVCGYQEAFPDALCAAYLCEQGRLQLASGPNVPPALAQAATASTCSKCNACQQAGAHAEPLRTEALSANGTDQRCHTELLNSEPVLGLQARWALPAISSQGEMLGLLVLYLPIAAGAADYDPSALRRGAYLVALAVERDRAEQQRLSDQAALRNAAQQTRAILDNMLDGVITTNRQGRITSFNKAAYTIFGYPANEMLGLQVMQLLADGQPVVSVNHLVGSARELQARRKDGSAFPISLAVSRILQDGQMLFIGIVRDITQRYLHEERIRHLAFYDPLTELPNRRLFLDRLQQAIATSARNAQHAALMFMDLDNFKQLNDSHGHAIGDQLLCQVAQRLRACVREGDSVARLGGDEFVLLFEGLSPLVPESAVQTELVAQKLLFTLGQPYQLGALEVVNTPSIGAVVFLGDGDSAETLVGKADIAMYQAKASGRNAVRFFDPAMQAALNAQAWLAQDMRRGLAQREFLLFYQFQVDVQGQPLGAEALLRWNHASRGIVPPAEFMAVAEESGLSLLLGPWVLDAACAQLRVWSDQEVTRRWTLAVNVSASQFALGGFVEQVRASLERAGAEPQRLVLELTEDILLADIESASLKLQALKRLGVRLSLDDFGTGYSSLLHLQRLPLDQLKIDQRFVHTLLHPDRGDVSVARSVVVLGHSLGLTVVAEGVESAEQRNALAALGCDAFQGYYFGKPGPVHELEMKNTPPRLME